MLARHPVVIIDAETHKFSPSAYRSPQPPCQTGIARQHNRQSATRLQHAIPLAQHLMRPRQVLEYMGRDYPVERLVRDATLRSTMGGAARVLAAAEFDQHRIIDRTLDAYRTLPR